jgi:hypothetical protein
MKKFTTKGNLTIYFQYHYDEILVSITNCLYTELFNPDYNKFLSNVKLL